MSFFKSLFGSSEPSKPAPEKLAVETLHRFAQAVMGPEGETAFLADELRRQILCAYCFGIVHALAQQHGLGAPQAHAVALVFFTRHMGYSPEAAAQQAEGLIAATGDANPKNTHKAIMHRGIDAFLSWQGAPATFEPSDFHEILRRLQGTEN
jgi:hypothetical protein